MSFSHALGMLLHPDKEWQSIRKEQPATMSFTVYLLLMSAIPVICIYFGATQIGWTLPGNSEITHLTSESAAFMSILGYFAMLAGVILIAGFIHWMSSTFDSNPTLKQCLVFTTYVATPLFFGGFFGLIPSLWTAMLAGLVMISWSAYLLYTGLPVFMDIPFEKGLVFASSVLCVALVILVAVMATTVTFWGLGVGPVYM